MHVCTHTLISVLHTIHMYFTSEHVARAHTQSVEFVMIHKINAINFPSIHTCTLEHIICATTVQRTDKICCDSAMLEQK